MNQVASVAPALFTFEDLEWRVLGLCEGRTRAQILAAVRQTDPGSPSVEDVDAILRVFEELSLVRTESECPERGVATAGKPTRQDD